MNGIFYIGATGLNAGQTAVDLIANNVANINTAAFKRGTVSFSELISPVVNTSHNRREATTGSGAGVMVNPTLHVFDAGDLHATGNRFDLAIRGEGFIPLVAQDNQALLWRGGTLKINTDGYLAAEDGTALAAEISVPVDATDLTIHKDGRVFVTMPDQAEPLEIGQIELALPTDKQALEALGSGVYRMNDDGLAITQSRPGEDNAGLVEQGFSEASNVQLSDELVSLMVYQRAYAANARLVQVGDELMSIANGLKR
ncbi:flagellar hook-basal body complex protein [Dyella sp.]|uniref:flagellar hook-basal body protein n=1 Tax=Dyella sp. TaxID=1869338 RepID=UPI002FD9B3F5